MDISGDDVTIMHAASGATEHMTVAEAEAWKNASERRIYYPADGAPRTKLSSFVQSDQADDGQVTDTEMVQVLTQDGLQYFTQADWQAWCATVSGNP